MSLTSQAETAGQSLPVVLSPPHPTLGAQRSVEPGQVTFQGNRLESAALLPGPGRQVEKSNPSQITFSHTNPTQGGVRDSKTHKLGTSWSPGLLRRPVFHRLDVYGFKRPEYYRSIQCSSHKVTPTLPPATAPGQFYSSPAGGPPFTSASPEQLVLQG